MYSICNLFLTFQVISQTLQHNRTRHHSACSNTFLPPLQSFDGVFSILCKSEEEGVEAPKTSFVASNVQSSSNIPLLIGLVPRKKWEYLEPSYVSKLCQLYVVWVDAILGLN
jgi:hypothetical protein